MSHSRRLRSKVRECASRQLAAREAGKEVKANEVERTPAERSTCPREFTFSTGTAQWSVHSLGPCTYLRPQLVLAAQLPDRRASLAGTRSVTSRVRRFTCATLEVCGSAVKIRGTPRYILKFERKTERDREYLMCDTLDVCGCRIRGVKIGARISCRSSMLQAEAPHVPRAADTPIARILALRAPHNASLSRNTQPCTSHSDAVTHRQGTAGRIGRGLLASCLCALRTLRSIKQVGRRRRSLAWRLRISWYTRLRYESRK